MKKLLFLALSVFFTCTAFAQTLQRLEYFFDTDPGVGNGTGITSFTNGNTVNHTFNVSTNGLVSGNHNLFIRFQYSDGTWGIHEGRPFSIQHNPSTISGKEIVLAEYFFDSDPGEGNGTPINNFNFNDTVNLSIPISVAGLSTGNHQLFFRFKNQDGEWGIHEGRSFFIQGPTSSLIGQNIILAEYFFDTDPGVGNGTLINNFTPNDTIDLNIPISTNGLSAGNHQLFFRYKNSAGEWGIHEGRSFFIQEPSGSTANQNLVSAEYFFDNDPGIGNGTIINNFSPNDSVDLNLPISVNGLSTGNHQLFFRFKNSDGKWGIHEGGSFFVQASSLTNGGVLTSGEYFFDTDPGFGNGFNFTNFNFADSVNANLNIQTTGLSSGFHKLFLRFKDSDDKWSIHEGRIFHLQDSQESGHPFISEAEYFFDSDPGIGNGTNLGIFFSGDSVSGFHNASVSGLPSGFHQLFVRFKNNFGEWSIHEGRPFYIREESIIQNGELLTNAEYFFNSDPGFGNGIPLNSFNPTDTVDFQANINVSSLSIGTTHHLYIRFKDELGRWGIHEGGEFERLPCDPPIADFTFNTPVCLNNTLTLIDNSTIVNGSSIYEWDTDNDGSTDLNTNGNIQLNFSTPGIYDVKLKISNGTCSDSITKTINVHPEFILTEVHTACDSFTWTDGVTYTSSNSIATQFLQTNDGCDSTVHLDLTIINSSSSTDVVTSCGSYTWIDGITYSSSNNTATHVVSNSQGCDSTITLDLTIAASYNTTDVVQACDSYTWIDGVTYTNSNNSTTHLLQAVNGCDSLISLDLTINNSSSSTDVITACDSYTWINGTTYTTSNNNATFVVTNAQGCDSTITLDLTILHSTIFTEVVTACDQYTWSDGVTYTSNNNTASQTLTNTAGCDSIITLDLTILQSNSAIDQIVACDSYTWIDGVTYTSNNNSATFVLQNANGCDSIVTLDLTINASSTGTDAIISCGPYTWIDGVTYTSSNNTATTVLQNIDGCDSIVTLDLTVNTIYSETDVVEACESFTWIDGNTYSQSNNTASITLQSIHGCDSTITLNLTISPAINTTVNLSGIALTSAQPNADNYQWVDCNNGFQAISGATSDTYTPTANGVFAVIIENGSCTDTSECITMDNVGLSELEYGWVKVYPNPTKGMVHISLDQPESYELLEVYDMRGALLLQKNTIQPTIAIDLPLANGVYVIHLYGSDDSKQLVRVVKF